MVRHTETLHVYCIYGNHATLSPAEPDYESLTLAARLTNPRICPQLAKQQIPFSPSGSVVLSTTWIPIVSFSCAISCWWPASGFWVLAFSSASRSRDAHLGFRFKIIISFSATARCVVSCGPDPTATPRIHLDWSSGLILGRAWPSPHSNTQQV